MTYFCYLIASKKCLSLQYNSIVSVYGCKDTKDFRKSFIFSGIFSL